MARVKRSFATERRQMQLLLLQFAFRELFQPIYISRLIGFFSYTIMTMNRCLKSNKIQKQIYFSKKPNTFLCKKSLYETICLTLSKSYTFYCL